jgi:arylsulfatase A
MFAFSIALTMSAAFSQVQPVPNIVLIYADDMGFGDLGVQNPNSKIPTPNLDRLAQQGTRFTDAHSSSGVCTPSRYAMLEGRYHWRKFHGIVNSFEESVLDSERTTLAELVRGRGYKTACIGKWHLGWNWKAIKNQDSRPDPKSGFAPDAFDWEKPIAGGPCDHGFDYYFGDDVPNFPPYAWFENDRLMHRPTVGLVTPEKTAEGAWEARPGPSVEGWDFWGVMPKLTQRAVQWIEEQSEEQPFFLYFPLTSPHAPIVPATQYRGASEANGYGDFVVQTDDAVGRVLQALDSKGFTENTWVIFTSDNGPEHYAYERVRVTGHRSMGPLRGLKRDLFEGGHRVPMIMRWPNRIPSGRVSDGLISQIDFYATFAKALGMEIPSGQAEDSVDQTRLLFGEASNRTELVHNTNPNGYALRQGEWVFIQAKTGAVSKEPSWYQEANGYGKESEEGGLYNLRQDLSQKTNLAESNTPQVQSMKQRLGEILTNAR